MILRLHSHIVWLKYLVSYILGNNSNFAVCLLSSLSILDKKLLEYH